MARILFADDDDIVASVAGDAFRRRGHDVVAGADGQAALDALKAEAPNLLILDCAMPRLSGFDTLRIIRQSPRHLQLPVLIVTAYPASTHMLPALCEGADGYIRKPFDPRYLVYRAESMLCEGGVPQDKALTAWPSESQISNL